MAATLTEPADPGRRYELIDIVRGFALAGILLANLVWATQWEPLTDEQRAAMPTHSIDMVATIFTEVFVEPESTSRLDLEEEVRSMELALNGTEHRDLIRLIHKHAVRPDDLIRLVRDHEPSVIHFSGHGTRSGIQLRGDGNEVRAVDGKSLRQFLSGRGIELLVLNACYTQRQTEEIEGAVPSVIGTTHEIDDEAARRFSVAFYRSVGNGLSLRQALRDGRDAIVLHGLDDVLCHKGELDRTLVGREP